MIAAPALFAIPVVVEFIQHVVEHRIGMFEGPQAAAALEQHPARVVMGHLKSLAITFAWLWIPGYMAAARGAWTARAITKAAWAGFLKVLCFWIVLAVVQAGAGMAMRDGGAGHWTILIATLITILISLTIETLTAPWKTASVLGDGSVSLVRSLKLAAPILLWGLALVFLATFPLLIVHQVLNAVMVFAQSPIAFWGLALADSVLVGWLAVLMAAPSYFIYRRALMRRGETPLGEP